MAATIDPFVTVLPNGNSLYFCTTFPFVAGDLNAQAGDYAFMLTSVSGTAALFRCTVAGNPGTWEPCSNGAHNVVTKTADYTALVTDSLIVASSGSNTVAVTLPAPALVKGQSFTVKRNGSGNNATVTTSAGSQIDTGSTITLSADLSSITLISNGTIYLAAGTRGTASLS